MAVTDARIALPMAATTETGCMWSPTYFNVHCQNEGLDSAIRSIMNERAGA